MAAACWVARPEEADTVARLLVAFRDHMGKEWPSANAFLASVERLLDDRATDFLLATPDEESPPGGVAQLRYRWSVWTAADDCWLEDLFVAGPARRHGVGAALLAAAVARARERGCRRIELDVDAANAPARALYEAHGFRADLKSPGSQDLFLGLRLD
ncbi:MAG TPA: GNAT family N-acetyltransferase [Solirubrobacteraceae bacterium]|nr:GNAT family N-acetyltransferase [Solirubrobacteraceae bacterium]